MSSSIINLYDAKTKGTFQVSAVPNIGLLQNLGLRIGTQVKIQNRYALGGPVLLHVDGAFVVAIGKDIATQIAVKEIRAS